VWCCNKCVCLCADTENSRFSHKSKGCAAESATKAINENDGCNEIMAMICALVHAWHFDGFFVEKIVISYNTN